MPFKHLENSLAVVVLTLNEEVDLPQCLAAIPDGIDIIVIDSGSTDDTVSLAQKHGARVVQTHWRGHIEQRHFALRECDINKDWVLLVDADEVFPSEFFKWTESFISRSPVFDIVQVSSKIVLDGKKLNFAPGYPLYHPRLLRRSTAFFLVGNTGANYTVPKGLKVKKVNIPYIHYWHSGYLFPWMYKHLMMAKTEAESAQIAQPLGYKTVRMRMNRAFEPGFFRCLLRLIYHLVLRCGFLDGKAGFRYSLMYFWYEVTIWVMSKQEKSPYGERIVQVPHLATTKSGESVI